MFNQRNQSNPFAGLPPNGMFDFGPKNITYKIVTDISSEIPTVMYVDNWEVRGLIPADCGDFCTTDINLVRFWPLLKGKSYTGQIVCWKHIKFCRSCGKVVCIAGNADGLLFDCETGKSWWLCLECHDKESKKLRTNQIIRGLLRGLGWRLPE